MLLTILTLVGVSALVTGCAVFARVASQRRARRALRLDGPESIDDALYVSLGGVEQWVTVRGEDRRRPILLVLHGGPGAPYSVLTPDLRCWERDFVVVQWDRRGVGKTLRRNGKRGSGELTFARMTGDAIELCEWLLGRLGHSRLFLLSSSAGSLIALPLVQQRPELFAALVATDLNVGGTESDAETHDQLVAWARRRGARRVVAFLEETGADPRRWTAAQFNRRMRILEGTLPKERRLSSIFLRAVFRSPWHDLGDVRAVLTGMFFAGERLHAELVSFDARHLPRRYQLPLLVFQGEDDVFTRPSAARSFLASVDAPSKRFELLPGCGHLGAFTRPEAFVRLLREYVVPLASEP